MNEKERLEMEERIVIEQQTESLLRSDKREVDVLLEICVTYRNYEKEIKQFY